MLYFNSQKSSTAEWLKISFGKRIPDAISRSLLIFMKCLKYFLIYFTGLLILTHNLPVLIVLACVSTIIIRLLIIKERLEPMAAADVAMALEDFGSKPVVTGVLKLKGKPDIENIRKSFEDKVLPRERKLKEYISNRMGYIFWKEEQPFDISRHIYQQYTDASGDSMANKVRLFAENQINYSFPEKISPWEIVILKENGDDESFYVVIRVHHAIGDGISLVFLLISTMADEALALPLQSRVTIPRQSFADKLYQAAFYLKCLIGYPIFIYKHFVYSKSNTLQADNLSGIKMSLVSEEINFEDLKNMKDASKTSVTAVIMTSILEALRSHFKRTMKPADFPNTISAVIPIIFKLPREDLVLSNLASMGMEEFSTSTMASQERLLDTYKTLEVMKRSPYINLLTGWLVKFLPFIPSWIMNRISRRSNVVFSFTNVPGPPESLRLWGHELLQTYALVPNKGNTGITISMLSYAGVVRLGIVADTAVVGSRDKLKTIMDDLMCHLQQLKGKLLH